jgi:peptidoglycan/xylan/chitin deacetylase (PgdA/CDA1 family)
MPSLKRAVGVPKMILSYHHIAEKAGSYTVSLHDFGAQLDWLFQQGYQVVSLSAYLDFLLQHGHNHEKQVVLTFDDAFQSFADLGMPELERRQLPVALFVPTGYFGKSDDWNRASIQVPIMGAETLQELAGCPLLTIGSHTVSHPILARLGTADLAWELRSSKKQLEQLTGRPVDYLAYPFGQPFIDVNTTVQKAAADAGYKAALSTSFQISNKADNLYCLNRITVEGYHQLNGFRNAIRPFSLRSLKQQLKNGVSYLTQRSANKSSS